MFFGWKMQRGHTSTVKCTASVEEIRLRAREKLIHKHTVAAERLRKEHRGTLRQDPEPNECIVEQWQEVGREMQLDLEDTLIVEMLQNLEEEVKLQQWAALYGESGHNGPDWEEYYLSLNP